MSQGTKPALIQLGGRTFREIGESTLEHDLWFLGQRDRAGLTRLEMLQGETPEEFAERFTGELAGSGAALLMLGALIVPGDVRNEGWTPALAEDTARFLGKLSDPKDKLQVQGMLAGLVLRFFRAGSPSSRTSPSSSATSTRNGPGSPIESEAARATETGAGPSDSSPNTTLSGGSW